MDAFKGNNDFARAAAVVGDTPFDIHVFHSKEALFANLRDDVVMNIGISLPVSIEALQNMNKSAVVLDGADYNSFPVELYSKKELLRQQSSIWYAIDPSRWPDLRFRQFPITDTQLDIFGKMGVPISDEIYDTFEVMAHHEDAIPGMPTQDYITDHVAALPEVTGRDGGNLQPRQLEAGIQLTQQLRLLQQEFAV
jgi:hypothetical protein